MKMVMRGQLSMIPKTFHCDLPEPLNKDVLRCQTDEQVRQVGIEWAVNQCQELLRQGVPNLHFYTVGTADSIKEIAKRIY